MGLKIKRIKIAFTSVGLCMAVLLGTAAQGIIGGSALRSKSPKTLLKNISGLSGETEYAHGIKTDSDGNFVFSYGEKTYKNEWERLMAEDGFIYGVNWDWFGSWQQDTANIGNNNITGTKNQYKQAQVERALYNMKALGYNCWANWIGPKGMFTYNDDGLVSGLEPTFETNLTLLLESCRKVGIDFVPGILTHYYGASAKNVLVNGLTNEERFHKYFRFYYEEEARQAYIDNGVSKVCRILAKYQDVIPCIALTIENGSNTNDVNTGMLYHSSNAVAWEDFAKLQNAMYDAVKAEMPNMLTSTEDIGGWPDNEYKYNDLKVDILGYNYYGAEAPIDISGAMLTRPTYLGEMDVFHDGADYAAVSDDYLTRIRSRLWENAVKGGYCGAFYYPFFYNDISEKSTFFSGASTDRYDQFRAFVINAAYTIIDLKNEFHNISDAVDKPSLLYNNGGNTLYWLGGRNVDYFILERSDNGGEWKTVADNISGVDNMISNGLITYTDETLKEGVNYRYRVTAVNQNGKKAISDIGNEFELFIPEESFVDGNGNYAGGFEQGGLTGSNTWPNSNGWYKDEDWVPEIGQFIKGDARTGEYSFVVDLKNGIGTLQNIYAARINYNLTLKPNTQYRISFWAKNTNIMYGVTVFDGDWNQLLWTYPYSGEGDGWGEVEAAFTTGEDGKIRLRLSNLKQEDAYLKIDDFSIKEVR